MRDNNGKFAKGNSGRPKGSKNKDISVFKKALKTGLIERLGDFFDLLDSDNLPEKDRINAYLKALEFVMPKQQKIELDADMTTNLIQVKFESTNVLPIHNETDFLDD
jgi:hypothetical protein